ncbi:MarR family winged helix-turn-helix transcriptional regulator [Anaeromicrobium sediminis]|uniref:MarR family transcriptional regulator n=1 Tax=Anaeromicrobium sediminis TaxID=1478221 RepID=A0A267ML09_9FIRM|nr:MarR family transcriptional regulator [Anaeromicrobium sediminis]PAB60107.1 MarR family transcriptional regulator [Anaeromicrobium sediminis]
MKKESLGKYIAAIHRNSQSIINKKLEDYHIGSGQHDFLYVISNNEGISQKELSNLLNIGKGTTAKAVKNLLKSGYIKREKNMDDKRFYRLYLTDKGKEIVPTINLTFEEMIAIYGNGFSEEEYIHILNSLKKILKNMHNVKNEINCDE